MFWTNSNVPRDPKRKYRWVLINGNNIPQWICKKVTKPGFTISETPHKYINHTFYFPGKVEWEKITLTLVDPVDPDAGATVMAIVEAGGYVPPHNENDTTTISKAAACRALGEVKIQQIDAEGSPVEEWILKNAWITSAKFGELDYDSDEMSNIDIELRYDFAVYRSYTSGGANGPANMKGKKNFPTTWNNS